MDAITKYFIRLWLDSNLFWKLFVTHFYYIMTNICRFPSRKRLIKLAIKTVWIHIYIMSLERCFFNKTFLIRIETLIYFQSSFFRFKLSALFLDYNNAEFDSTNIYKITFLMNLLIQYPNSIENPNLIIQNWLIAMDFAHIFF